MPGPSAGDLSAVGFAFETTPLQYVAPSKWLFPSSNGIQATPDKVAKDVMSGARSSGRIKRTAKFQTGGAVGYQFFATHGAALQKAVFGGDTFLAALAADTVKTATPVSTVAGLSLVTVTNTAAVTYVVGAWIKVAAGTASEARQIQVITGNTAPGTVLSVAALITNAAAAAGTAVQQMAQHKLITNTTGNTLPTVSVENNEGSAYSWKLAGGLVDKFSLKAAQDVMASIDFFFQAVPVKTAPTTVAPSAGELADMQHPFTDTDSIVVGYQDPLQSGGVTGASALQGLTWIEDWGFEYDNKLKKTPCHDLTQAYKAFPTTQVAKFTYKYINQSSRLSEFEDYLTSLAGLTIPLCASLATNISATAAENWRCWGVYSPANTLFVTNPARSIGDVITASVEAEPVNLTASGDMLNIFIVNADVGGPY